LLKEFFGVVGTALMKNGGEILKFMDDGILAIFHTPDEAHASQRIVAALTTAESIVPEFKAARLRWTEGSNVESSNRETGLALHFGEVACGNSGA
jgi:adenylate cyclase